MTTPPAIKVLLLDIGGVLVELDPDAATGAWFDPALSAEQNWANWLGSADSQALERGEISPVDFAARLIDRHSLDTTPDAFVDGFRRWVVGFFPGAFALLNRVQSDVRLGVFSNITEVHWHSIRQQLERETQITHYFASYLIGQAKPTPDAYRFVCREMNVSPEQVLFVDDNVVNVDGARRAGLIAERAAGIEELAQILRRYRLFRD